MESCSTMYDAKKGTRLSTYTYERCAYPRGQTQPEHKIIYAKQELEVSLELSYSLEV